MPIIFYDKSPGEGFMQWCLWLSWAAGARLFKLFGLAGAAVGISSLDEMSAYLQKAQAAAVGGRFAEIQYWGHGSPGTVWISEKPTRAVDWAFLKQYLAATGLLWLRCCSVYRGAEGQTSAKAFTEAVGCRVAAHTRIIGILQGGLWVLAPGKEPAWSVDEGELPGALAPMGLAWGPRQVLFLKARLPAWA